MLIDGFFLKEMRRYQLEILTQRGPSLLIVICSLEHYIFNSSKIITLLRETELSLFTYFFSHITQETLNIF